MLKALVPYLNINTFLYFKAFAMQYLIHSLVHKKSCTEVVLVTNSLALKQTINKPTISSLSASHLNQVTIDQGHPVAVSRLMIVRGQGDCKPPCIASSVQSLE